jgi:uncharacterized protein YdeI (YjbR/CyaY-like superfamily)
MASVRPSSSEHPATWKFGYPIYHAETRAQWRAWLQLLTPRKPRGTWTRLNRQRVADMEAAGLMTDAGRRAVEVARGNGWWTILDPVEDLVEPDDLATALDANVAARHAWDRFPPSAQKAMLWWVISAVKDDTRTRRIETIVAKAAAGERAQG